MNIPDDALANSKAVAIDMTPERKEKWQTASYAIVDLVRAHTSGPIEALALLRFVMSSLAETYKIDYKGSFMLGDGDVGRS